MPKRVVLRILLLFSMLLLLSCSERREARRKALEEIRAMPNEEMAVHPLVDEIKDFQRQLEELQALLDGEDPEKALAGADAAISELRKDLSDLESDLRQTDRELLQLKIMFDDQLKEMEDRP